MTGVTLEKVVKKYGDVQVIHGVDLKVEDGDLSVVLGDAAYSELSVTVDKGAVDSAIPLEGSILGRSQAKYRGYPKQGQYSMELEARNGDIILD